MRIRGLVRLTEPAGTRWRQDTWASIACRWTVFWLAWMPILLTSADVRDPRAGGVPASSRAARFGDFKSLDLTAGAGAKGRCCPRGRGHSAKQLWPTQP